jgi:hypothetical protein
MKLRLFLKTGLRNGLSFWDRSGAECRMLHAANFLERSIAPNNVKRIVTRAGNRLQMIDTPGKETLVIATPNHSSISVSEKSDGTGRTLVTVQSDGDIVLLAHQGRAQIRSKFSQGRPADGIKSCRLPLLVLALQSSSF